MKVLDTKTSPTRILMWAVVTLLVITAAWMATHRYSSNLEVYYLDVGQGDSAIIRTPSGHVILIDAGRISGSSDKGQTTVVPALRALGLRKIDLMVWTHPDADHIGGMRSVMNAVEVGSILDTSAIEKPSPVYEKLLKETQQRKIPYRKAKRGQWFDFGDGVKAEVLSPVEGYVGSNNDESIILRFTLGKNSFLFEGDAGYEEEGELLSSGILVQSDALKVSHHGSRTGSKIEWIAKVQPKFAIISVGKKNPFGHPHAETLQMLENVGAQIFRTDRDGTIIAESDGQQITVHPWR
jgi:competence protein ComEC